MKSNRYLLWSFLFFWAIIVGLLQLKSSCWFYHFSEDSFSELMSLVFYGSSFLLFLLHIKEKWIYSLIAVVLFVAFMEEANWGQNFFSSLSWEQLETDYYQKSIHNIVKVHGYEDHFFVDYIVEAAQIVLYFFIPIFFYRFSNVFKFSLAPFLVCIFISYFIGIRFDFGFYLLDLDFGKLNCLGGGLDEAHELYFSSCIFYYSCLWFNRHINRF